MILRMPPYMSPIRWLKYYSDIFTGYTTCDVCKETVETIIPVILDETEAAMASPTCSCGMTRLLSNGLPARLNHIADAVAYGRELEGEDLDEGF